MKTQFALRCIAPDGDHVTESDDFDTPDAAWNRSNDMGSRWSFYPIHVVTTGARSSRRAIIRAVPHGMPREWEGRTLGRLLDCIAADPDHACDYCNGVSPFCIHP